MPFEQDPYVEATTEDLHSKLWAQLVYDEQYRQASIHAGKNSPFVQIPFHPRDLSVDPENSTGGFSGQLLDDFCIEPDMTPGLEAFIEVYAEKFQKGFPAIVDSFYENKLLLDNIDDKLVQNQNVVVVTNHGEIYDIAIIEAALRVALARHAVDNLRAPLTGDRYNLIVHRMISQLGIPDAENPDSPAAPALEILKLVGETYLSFARTENSKKAQIPQALDRKCNELMLETLGKKMSNGGQILAFAPSGSKDESIRDRFGKWFKVLKPVNKGTYKIMRDEKSWILAVGVALDHADGPVCSISELSQCQTDEECHLLLESIAERHARLTRIKTVYARKQADLDSWREEASETVMEVSEDPEKRHKIFVTAGVIAASTTLGYAIGRRSRDRKHQ